MQLLGREMARRGIECEYWFCRGSNRLAEFMETGRATVGPLSELAPRLARGDFDIVHMTATDPAAAVVASMAGKARVIVTARGALADIWTRENCFAYTAISNGMADINQPYTDVALEVVRNSIDVDRFAPAAERAEGAPIVAFVGRTTSYEKNFPRFTRIARRLVDRGARVWIADAHGATWGRFDGKPVERIPTERWGPVPHGEMADFYRAVAASGGVVVMTSRSEGFGNVAPEAAACGARVAAPDVMGLREAVLPGVTGMLYPAAASDDDVAGRIQSWLDGPHDMGACADAARAEFSPSVMMDKYLDIYARAEQRVVPSRPAPAADPELADLLVHLVRQREWRAAAAREAAVDFAGAGYTGLAMGALGIAFRAAPTQFVRRAGARQLLQTAVRIARRPATR